MSAPTLALRSLVCHPATPGPAPGVDRILAEVSISNRALQIDYTIAGDLSALRIPPLGDALNPERLWEHTCCELFVAPIAGDAYVEWNFSPTGQSAQFAFSSYRVRAGGSAATGATVSRVPDPAALRLRARVPLPPFAAEAARISITTVVEHQGGTRSYWALRHSTDQPDFHHLGGFGLALRLLPSPAIVDAKTTDP